MLVKCESCGKFFGADSPDQKLCSSCAVTGQRLPKHIAESGDPKFVVARDIVYDHPAISPEDLKKQMSEMDIDISVKEIMSYVREGRLSMVTDINGPLCEECGRPILSGRLCPRCSSNLEKAISKGNEPKVKETREIKAKNSQMHIKK